MGNELITLGVSTVVGFYFKYLMQKAADLKEEREWLYKRVEQQTANADRAAQRVPIDMGAGIRRLIVVSCVFALIYGSFCLSLFGKTTYVEHTQIQPSSFFGLIPETTRKFYVEVPGFLITEDMRQVMSAICGFYLGQGVDSTKK